MRPHRPGALLQCWLAAHPTLYVRRQMLLNCGGFDRELRLFEQIKIHSHYLPRTLVRMRMGGASTGSWGNVLKGNLEAMRSVRSHGYSGGIGFVTRKILSRIPRFLSRPA